MPKAVVTLTDDELRWAVVEWAEKHHGMIVDPVKVSVRINRVWKGPGPMWEENLRFAVVEFETS